MKKSILFLGCAAIAAVSLKASASSPRACDPYDREVVRVQSEIDNFETAVVLPLQKERDRVKAALDNEINGPSELRKTANDERKQIARLQQDILNSPAEIDAKRAKAAAIKEEVQALLASGVKDNDPRIQRKRQAAKDLRAEADDLEAKLEVAQTKIAIKQAKIVANEAQANEIEQTPPSISELQAQKQKIDAELANTDALRTQKTDQLNLVVEAARLCVSYNALDEMHDATIQTILAIRPDPVGSCAPSCDASMPWPKSPAESQGRQDARRAMGCRF